MATLKSCHSAEFDNHWQIRYQLPRDFRLARIADSVEFSMIIDARDEGGVTTRKGACCNPLFGS